MNLEVLEKQAEAVSVEEQEKVHLVEKVVPVVQKEKKLKKKGVFKFRRVDSLHQDVDVPLSAKSGEDFTIDHDGAVKTVKVPKGSKGTTIRIKMVSKDGSSVKKSWFFKGPGSVFGRDGLFRFTSRDLSEKLRSSIWFRPSKKSQSSPKKN